MTFPSPKGFQGRLKQTELPNEEKCRALLIIGGEGGCIILYIFCMRSFFIYFFGLYLLMFSLSLEFSNCEDESQSKKKD